MPVKRIEYNFGLLPTSNNYFMTINDLKANDFVPKKKMYKLLPTAPQEVLRLTMNEVVIQMRKLDPLKISQAQLLRPNEWKEVLVRMGVIEREDLPQINFVNKKSTSD